MDEKSVKDRILEDFTNTIDKNLLTAQASGLTLGQWQDIANEVVGQVMQIAHWSNIAGWPKDKR